ncbi:MAG: YqeG family HAD IIIA-type phosphatase [Mycoplasmoidaceae bacterium]
MNLKINTYWLNYLRPDNYIKSIQDVNFENLYQQGIRVIICDLDNTLVPSFKSIPSASNIDLVKHIKSIGFRLYIVSNNRKERVEKFITKLEEKVKIDGYLSSTFKPFIFKIKKLFINHQIDASETLFIGDQFITDILAANRIKAQSILVLSIIDTVNDLKFSNRFFNFMENFIYKKLSHEKSFIKQNNHYNNQECELL